jgi:hypothetical protein
MHHFSMTSWVTSVEALSTTTTSKGSAAFWAANEARQSSSQPALFQVEMITDTRGPSAVMWG